MKPSNVALVTMLSTVSGLAVGACAGRESPSETWQLAAQRRNEITALWTQIRDWRREAHMEIEPQDSQVMAMRRATVSSAATVCPVAHVPPPACDDVCGLADAICENAEAICDIAGELHNDPWASEKCGNAKASCREGQVRCCGCEPPEVPASEVTTSSPDDAEPVSSSVSAPVNQ